MSFQMPYEGYDFSKFIKEMDNKVSQYIEEMAAAFVLHTQLPPDRVVMILQPDFSTWGYRIWFEERKIENEDRTNVNH